MPPAPQQAVNGRPLLDTYREWLEGPYAKAGVQCQHCHMLNREHTWKGVRDQGDGATGVRRQRVSLSSTSSRTSPQALALDLCEKRGCGHFFPTSPPCAWLTVEHRRFRKTLTKLRRRIGRDIDFIKEWREVEVRAYRPASFTVSFAVSPQPAECVSSHSRHAPRRLLRAFYERWQSATSAKIRGGSDGRV